MTPTNPPRTSMVGYEVFWGGEGWRVKEGWRQHEGNYILRPEIRIAKVDKDWNGMLIWGVWSLTAFWKAQSSNTCRVIVSRVHFQLSEASSVSLTVECRILLLSRQLLCSLVFEDLSLVYKEQSDVFVLIVLFLSKVLECAPCALTSVRLWLSRVGNQVCFCLPIFWGARFHILRQAWASNDTVQQEAELWLIYSARPVSQRDGQEAPYVAEFQQVP